MSISDHQGLNLFLGSSACLHVSFLEMSFDQSMALECSGVVLDSSFFFLLSIYSLLKLVWFSPRKCSDLTSCIANTKDLLQVIRYLNLCTRLAGLHIYSFQHSLWKKTTTKTKTFYQIHMITPLFKIFQWLCVSKIKIA